MPRTQKLEKIEVFVTKEEKEYIEERKEKTGESQSGYVRKLIIKDMITKNIGGGQNK